MDDGEQSSAPLIRQPPPTAMPSQHVFMENLNSNSPEWRRFENPIVFMEEKVLPEELEEAGLELARTGAEQARKRPNDVYQYVSYQKPGTVQSESRRHPLSQVTNADEVPTIRTEDDERVEELISNVDENDTGEGPDDTFEFLLK